MKRLVFTIRILALICVATLIASCVWAETSSYVYTVAAQPNKLKVDANVSWITTPSDAHYHMYWYQYTVTFSGAWGSWSPKPLSSFGVTDSGHLRWVDAYTSRADKFTATPTWVEGDTTQSSVSWSTLTPIGFAAGGTVEFGYFSDYAPQVVSSTAGGGGYISNGFTLGMVPEPAALLSLGLGFSGLAFAAKRRRR